MRWLLDPEPPGLGLDLRTGELSLARLSAKRGKPELDLCVTAPLPPNCLAFSLIEPNILDPKALRQSIDNVMRSAGANGAKRIALTLPDYVARISVVELAEAPRSTSETIDMLKFRLKKSVGFDTDQARLAFERIPGTKPAYLTGVMHESVVGQYEDFLAELGFEVGLVIPASVSLLQILAPAASSNLAPGADYFFVNVEREYFSVSLVRDREVPVLTRTLGLRSSNGDGPPVIYNEDDLLREIIPTAIYYREKLKGSSLERIYYRSLRPDLIHLRELLEEQFEAPTEPLNLRSALGIAENLEMDAALADSVSAAAGAALGSAA